MCKKNCNNKNCASFLEKEDRVIRRSSYPTSSYAASTVIEFRIVKSVYLITIIMQTNLFSLPVLNRYDNLHIIPNMLNQSLTKKFWMKGLTQVQNRILDQSRLWQQVLVYHHCFMMKSWRKWLTLWSRFQFILYHILLESINKAFHLRRLFDTHATHFFFIKLHAFKVKQ